MKLPKTDSSRRSFLYRLGLAGAAPAVAGGLGIFGSTAQALAGQAGPRQGPRVPEKNATGASWSREYWAQKGDVKLYLYRKRRSAPEPGALALPVLFLVHGSSLSSRSAFDLATPGLGEYSLMNVFAGYGFDVWTMDCEGYGRSSRTEGNADVAAGVADLEAAAGVVMRETGQRRFHFFGESSGGLRAGALAMKRPELVDRLVLAAFTYTGKGSPTLTERAKQLDFYRTHNRRPRDREMIRSIFTRDKAGTTDPAVAEVLADAELKFGDTVPTGTYLDMTANLPVVDPRKVRAPVLLIKGEYDGIATEEDLVSFFQQLPNGDRQLSVLSGMAHSVAMALNRHQFWHVTRSFLEMPPRH